MLNPAGGLTEPTGPANIHVTKSPGTLLARTARRIQSVQCPQPCPQTRQNIHTTKSPHGLFQYSREIHSRVQIPAAHAHEHSPAEHSSVQIPAANAHEHSPAEHSHCQIPTVDASMHPGMLA